MLFFSVISCIRVAEPWWLWHVEVNRLFWGHCFPVVLRVFIAMAARIPQYGSN